MLRFVGCSLLLIVLAAAGQSSTRTNLSITTSEAIWISATELSALPMSGAAWDQLKATADAPLSASPNLSERNGENVEVLAKALVYARTGTESYRQEVIAAVNAVIDTEGSDALGLARALSTYVIAADLVVLPAADDVVFRAWLVKQLDPNYVVQTQSLVDKNEKRPNNHGTMAGASRAAAAIYLGNTAELQRTADVFKGYLGDRSTYAGFIYEELSWQCDEAAPVGINPQGCVKNDPGGTPRSLDGVLPDDQRRCGSFGWPPCTTNYAWEGLQGAIAQAVILHRAGYDTFNWGDQALLRAVKWLSDEIGYTATGDDTWQLPLVDLFYGTSYWDGNPTNSGKNMGWTGWTHSNKKGR
jgi:hypothetical protein